MDGPKRDGKNAETSTLVLLARLTGVGWYVAIAITGGTLAGVWLDSRLDTRPVLMFVGLAAGLAAAIFGMLRLLRSFAAAEDNAASDGGKAE